MTPRPRYHILLIGIDDYRVRPLGGCINDIDAVQQLLLGRMGIPSDWICRLASPHPDARQPGAAGGERPAVAEQPATLANLRNALADLGTRRVGRNDRVFIYYAGHGARRKVRTGAGRTFHREALVMADHDPAQPGSGMLYDFELNRALRAIAEQTGSVTLVLDCCHAAGVTRSAGELRPPEVVASSEPIERYLDFERMAAVADPGPPPGDEDPRPLIAAAEHCHVVAACLGHERANEEREPDGVRHGLLTSALLAALAPTPDAALPALRWSEIWQQVCATVSQRNPAQHPRMVGNAARAVFAGPPVEHAAGIPVSQGRRGFRIAAGTLADITKGAVLAVYGDEPRRFPPVGSDEDRRARIGLVKVTEAHVATATAIAEGRPFELPPGARGRLVGAGEAARLRCTVIPRHPAVEAQLRASPLLHVVAPNEGPDVRLEHSDGRWYVTDQLYSKGFDRPVLCSLPTHELAQARAALEHYRAYSLPLRMAERMHDLDGGLSLRVRIPTQQRAVANVVDGANSQQLAATSADSYTLRAGAQVFFEVRNHSAARLRVTLVNAAASGKVQFLGDHMLDPGALHVFWTPGAVGVPFKMVLPREIDRGLDRLVAIGRTAHAHDLEYLRIDETFVDAVTVRRSRPIDEDDVVRTPPPIEQWTATQAIIETRR
jgi:hypothetical protein